MLAVFVGIVAISQCYPSGAPQETCKIFTANHTGHSAQNGRSKYDIKVNPSSVPSGGKATGMNSLYTAQKENKKWENTSH